MTKLLRYSAAPVIASMAFAGSTALADDDKMQLEAKAQQALNECASVAQSCSELVENASGVLVFPEVLRASLIVGGAGGDGVLMVDDQVQDRYNIGEASAGLQAGVDQLSIVYVFRNQESLTNLTENQGEWEVGAEAAITVGTADAAATAISGDPVVYAFGSEGLVADLDLSVLRIWPEREEAEDFIGADDEVGEGAS